MVIQKNLSDCQNLLCFFSQVFQSLWKKHFFFFPSEYMANPVSGEIQQVRLLSLKT